MMKNKARYVNSNDIHDGLWDSKGQLEQPETIHDKLYGLSLVPKQQEEFKQTFTPNLENSIT